MTQTATHNLYVVLLICSALGIFFPRLGYWTLLVAMLLTLLWGG